MCACYSDRNNQKREYDSEAVGFGKGKNVPAGFHDRNLNRRGFFHEIKQIIQKKENHGKYLYLFMVDMDGLKYINDNFGHAEGDFAIMTLANVLAEMGRGDAVCARVSGGEFICAYVEDRVQCFIAERFSAQMEELIGEAEGIADKTYPVSASVGMISGVISEHLDLDAMINRADDRMYKHKMAYRAKTPDL